MVLVLIMSLVVSDIASSEGGFWWHDGAEGFVIGSGESKRSFMNDVFLVERFRRAVGYILGQVGIIIQKNILLSSVLSKDTCYMLLIIPRNSLFANFLFG